MAIIEYLFIKFPEASPEHLSGMKQQTVRNTTLAEVCQSLGL
jgi:dsRNA-specific ribonuclease